VQVFEPAAVGHRKVIVATNIAETSVTIPNVAFVVDGGLVKALSLSPSLYLCRLTREQQRWFDSATGIDALVTVPTSQASAQQRAGRAGRVRSGACLLSFSVSFSVSWACIEQRCRQGVPHVHQRRVRQAAGARRPGDAAVRGPACHCQVELTPPCRTNMAPVVLQLKAFGIDDIAHFDFMSPPPAESLERSIEVCPSLSLSLCGLIASGGSC
jgi:ATP-dependent RNA helicase DDX35